eukprot:COSAG01_NODE_1041_length_11959_cov_2.673356_1_plen_716_part_00
MGDEPGRISKPVRVEELESIVKRKEDLIRKGTGGVIITSAVVNALAREHEAHQQTFEGSRGFGYHVADTENGVVLTTGDGTSFTSKFTVGVDEPDEKLKRFRLKLFPGVDGRMELTDERGRSRTHQLFSDDRKEDPLCVTSSGWVIGEAREGCGGDSGGFLEVSRELVGSVLRTVVGPPPPPPPLPRAESCPETAVVTPTKSKRKLSGRFKRFATEDQAQKLESNLAEPGVHHLQRANSESGVAAIPEDVPPSCSQWTSEQAFNQTCAYWQAAMQARMGATCRHKGLPFGIQDAMRRAGLRSKNQQILQEMEGKVDVQTQGTGQALGKYLIATHLISKVQIGLFAGSVRRRSNESDRAYVHEFNTKEMRGCTGMPSSVTFKALGEAGNDSGAESERTLPLDGIESAFAERGVQYAESDNRRSANSPHQRPVSAPRLPRMQEGGIYTWADGKDFTWALELTTRGDVKITRHGKKQELELLQNGAVKFKGKYIHGAPHGAPQQRSAEGAESASALAAASQISTERTHPELEQGVDDSSHQFRSCLDRPYVQKEIRWAQKYKKTIIVLFEEDQRRAGFFDFDQALDKYRGTEWEAILNIDAEPYQRDEGYAQVMVQKILQKTQGVLAGAAAAPALNAPGSWDLFLSHAQATGGDQVQTTSLRMEKAGRTVWYDNAMLDRSTAAMEEGVRHCRCFMLFLTGDAMAAAAPASPSSATNGK